MANQKIIKNIQKGKFYHIHEGSPSGHPGMVYWKSDKRNLYLAITTDSSDGEHRTLLTTSTSSDVQHSYVYNRPTLAKRRDIGGQYQKMSFNKNDKNLLRVISIKKYRETKSIKSKDRRYIKKLKRKPRY